MISCIMYLCDISYLSLLSMFYFVSHFSRFFHDLYYFIAMYTVCHFKARMLPILLHLIIRAMHRPGSLLFAPGGDDCLCLCLCPYNLSLSSPLVGVVVIFNLHFIEFVLRK